MNRLSESFYQCIDSHPSFHKCPKPQNAHPQSQQTHNALRVHVSLNIFNPSLRTRDATQSRPGEKLTEEVRYPASGKC